MTDLILSYGKPETDPAACSKQLDELAKTLFHVDALCFSSHLFTRKILYHGTSRTIESVIHHHVAGARALRPRIAIGWTTWIQNVTPQTNTLLLDAFKRAANWVTMHPSASDSAIRKVVEMAQEHGRVEERVPLGIYASTVSEPNDEGIYESVLAQSEDTIVNFASRVCSLGVQGLICSGHELRVLSNTLGRDALPRVVAVNIWREGPSRPDRSEILSPMEAVRLGATGIVVEQSRTSVEDAQLIRKEMRMATAIP